MQLNVLIKIALRQVFPQLEVICPPLQLNLNESINTFCGTMKRSVFELLRRDVSGVVVRPIGEIEPL